MDQIQRKQTNTRPAAGTPVSFCAQVLYVGNEPFAALVLRDAQKRTFYIRKNTLYEKLLKQQYQNFHVQGIYYPRSILLPQADGSIEVKSIQKITNEY
ncbi:MAG: hypothetical protein AAF518_07445 [Spirochaetota bacterium]